MTSDELLADEAYKRFPDKIEPFEGHPLGKIVQDNGNLRYAFIVGAQYCLANGANQEAVPWPRDGSCIRCSAVPRTSSGLCNTCLDEDAEKLENSTSPAAGWDEAIEAAARIVRDFTGAGNNTLYERTIAIVQAIEALRRAAPAPEGVAAKSLAEILGPDLVETGDISVEGLQKLQDASRPDAGCGVRGALSDWSDLPKDIYVTGAQRVNAVGFDVQCCSVPMVTAPEVRYVRADMVAPVSPSEGVRGQIAALAHRFWSIHPSEIAAKNLTREEFYIREMTALVAGAEARLREALEKIAGSHWERIGHCQTDVDDVPNLTAQEAMREARKALSTVGDEAKKSSTVDILENAEARASAHSAGESVDLKDQDAGLIAASGGSSPSQSAPSDPTEDVKCEACFGTGRHMGRFSMNDPDCTYCNGTGSDNAKLRLRAHAMAQYRKAVDDANRMNDKGEVPSDPTTDRREIMARIIEERAVQIHIREHSCPPDLTNETHRWAMHRIRQELNTFADAILAALDGGTGA